MSRCRLFEDISRRSPEEQTALEEAWKSRRWNSKELVRCCIIYRSKELVWYYVIYILGVGL